MNELLNSVGTWLGNSFNGGAWRSDGWENPYTGFGTTRDKTVFTQFSGFFELSDQALDLIYTGDDIAQTIIDTEPEEMLRTGYFLNIEDSKTLGPDVLTVLERLETNENLVQTMSGARLFGGGATIIGADDGRPASMALVPERVRKLEWLEPVDRRYLTPATFYTSGPKTGKAETYMLGKPEAFASSPYLIHESRLLLFGGARTTKTERQRRLWWDHSVLQRPFEVMRAFATGYKAVEVLLTDGPQGVYKIKNLASLLGSNNRNKLDERLAIVEMFRSVMRAIVVDADAEGFERQSISFGGMHEILDKFMLRLAAAARMPVTLLMGQSPAGMNATGESDFRSFYGRVESKQPTYLGPKLRRLVEIILATKEGPSGGKSSQKIAIEFNPLWTLTPKEEDERRLSVAQADKIYYDMGAITPEEIALQRFGERGWQPGYRIDRELREFVLKAETAKVKAGDLTPVQGALTPTSNETIMTVDEARALLKLAPDSDPKIGKMKVTEYKAHLEAKAAVTGDAEGKEETGQDVTPPDATTPPSGATGPAPKKPSPKVPSGGQAA